jgi:hypothetical protein
MEEGTSYGTPAFKVGGKLVARLREDGESLAVGIGFEERESLLRRDPRVFFLTDHYLDYPWVLVHLSRVRRETLESLLKGAWERRAPKRTLKAARERP